MKKLTEYELQQRLQQVPNLLDALNFEQVIVWIYHAPNPQRGRWKAWLHRLIGK